MRTTGAHAWTCRILSSGIRTSALPDHSYLFAGGCHAQSAVQTYIRGSICSLSRTATAMFCAWVAWRICAVECSAVEAVTLLGKRSSDKSREDCEDGEGNHIRQKTKDSNGSV